MRIWCKTKGRKYKVIGINPEENDMDTITEQIAIKLLGHNVLGKLELCDPNNSGMTAEIEDVDLIQPNDKLIFIPQNPTRIRPDEVVSFTPTLPRRRRDCVADEYDGGKAKRTKRVHKERDLNEERRLLYPEEEKKGNATPAETTPDLVSPMASLPCDETNTGSETPEKTRVEIPRTINSEQNQSRKDLSSPSNHDESLDENDSSHDEDTRLSSHLIGDSDTPSAPASGQVGVKGTEQSSTRSSSKPSNINESVNKAASDTAVTACLENQKQSSTWEPAAVNEPAEKLDVIVAGALRSVRKEKTSKTNVSSPLACEKRHSLTMPSEETNDVQEAEDCIEKTVQVSAEAASKPKEHEVGQNVSEEIHSKEKSDSLLKHQALPTSATNTLSTFKSASSKTNPTAIPNAVSHANDDTCREPSKTKAKEAECASGQAGNNSLTPRSQPLPSIMKVLERTTDHNPHRGFLTFFYTKYNPLKLQVIDNLLKFYQNREAEMYQKISEVYKVDVIKLVSDWQANSFLAQSNTNLCTHSNANNPRAFCPYTHSRVRSGTSVKPVRVHVVNKDGTLQKSAKRG